VSRTSGGSPADSLLAERRGCAGHRMKGDRGPSAPVCRAREPSSAPGRQSSVRPVVVCPSRIGVRKSANSCSRERRGAQQQQLVIHRRKPAARFQVATAARCAGGGREITCCRGVLLWAGSPEWTRTISERCVHPIRKTCVCIVGKVMPSGCERNQPHMQATRRPPCEKPRSKEDELRGFGDGGGTVCQPASARAFAHRGFGRAS